MEVKRTFDILENLIEKYPKDDILSRKVNGKWIKFSSDSYYRHSHLMAYALLSQGLSPQDKVITISNNRPEWNFVDMGLTLAHMVHVPVYSTLSSDDYLHIIEHSDAKAIFLGGDALVKKIAPLLEKIDRKITVFTMDPFDGFTNIG